MQFLVTSGYMMSSWLNCRVSVFKVGIAWMKVDGQWQWFGDLKINDPKWTIPNIRPSSIDELWSPKSLIDFQNQLNDQNCGVNERLNKENYENVPWLVKLSFWISTLRLLFDWPNSNQLKIELNHFRPLTRIQIIFMVIKILICRVPKVLNLKN